MSFTPYFRSFQKFNASPVCVNYTYDLTLTFLVLSEQKKKTIWFCKTQYENKNKERTKNFESGCRHKELNLNPNIDLRNG